MLMWEVHIFVWRPEDNLGCPLHLLPVRMWMNVFHCLGDSQLGWTELASEPQRAYLPPILGLQAAPSHAAF